MTEFEEAIILANKVLDRNFADPDDDLAILARQFLRARERSFELEEQCADFVCRAIEAGATFMEAIVAWKKGPFGV